MIKEISDHLERMDLQAPLVIPVLLVCQESLALPGKLERLVPADLRGPQDRMVEMEWMEKMVFQARQDHMEPPDLLDQLVLLEILGHPEVLAIKESWARRDSVEKRAQVDRLEPEDPLAQSEHRETQERLDHLGLLALLDQLVNLAHLVATDHQETKDQMVPRESPDQED